jgi:hypothetical protein
VLEVFGGVTAVVAVVEKVGVDVEELVVADKGTAEGN